MYYVSLIEFTAHYHPEEGGYYQEGETVVHVEKCQTFRKARLKIRKWLKNTDFDADERNIDGGVDGRWVAKDKLSFGVSSFYVGEGYRCQVTRKEPVTYGSIPYC